MWQWASFRPARFAADETIFCRFLVESFPFRLVNKYSLPSCFLAWAWSSSNRNSGMLKIRSLFPFA